MEHVHSNLVSPVFGRRIDHLEQQTGGSRPLVGMLSFDSWREADHDCIYRLQDIKQSLEKEVETLRGQTGRPMRAFENIGVMMQQPGRG